MDKSVQILIDDAIQKCLFNSLQYLLLMLSNVQNSILIYSLVFVNKNRILKQFFSFLRKKSYSALLSVIGNLISWAGQKSLLNFLQLITWNRSFQCFFMSEILFACLPLSPVIMVIFLIEDPLCFLDIFGTMLS